MKFSKFNKIGKILQEITHACEVEYENRESSIQKDIQLFYKRNGLSAEKYAATLDVILESLIAAFNHQDNSYKKVNFKILLKDFIYFYHQYITTIETLHTSQKQCDFIVTANLFLPFFHTLLTHRFFYFDQLNEERFLFDRLLPDIGDTSKTAMQKVFEFITLDIDQHKCNEFTEEQNKTEIITNKKIIHALLLEEMRNQKIKENVGTDSIEKTISNWLSGRHAPDKTSFQYIMKLAKYCHRLDETHIKQLLTLAKIIDYFYQKSCQYFGKNSTETLIEYMRFQSILCYKQFILDHDNKDPEVNAPEIQDLLENLDIYCRVNNVSYTLLNYLNEACRNVYSKEKILRKHLEHMERYFMIIADIKQSTFSNHIDFFLRIRVFSPKDCNILTSDPYMQARLEGFINPNLDMFMNVPKDPYEHIDESYKSYTELRTKLLSLVLPNKAKTKEDEEKFLSILEQVKKDFKNPNDPYIHFVQARFYAHKAILEKQYLKDSQKHYLLALKYGEGVMGYHFKSVIDEGMIISAQNTKLEKLDLTNAKAPFTKFYTIAFCLGLIKSTPEEIEQYFVRDFKNKFENIFRHPYDGSITVPTLRITPDLSIASTQKIKNIPIDFNDPNRWIEDVYPHPSTQLMHCCQIQDLSSVKKLLACGADVNLLKKNDNATALICTLPTNFEPISNTQIQIAKLLIPRMTKEAINAKLVKHKETALSRAIENGCAELVKLLIKQGADLNMKITPDHVSPLYWCLLHIGYAKGTSEPIDDTPLDIKSMTKSSPIFSDDFGKDHKKTFMESLNNKNTKQILPIVERCKTEEFFQPNLKNYYQIFDLLLEHSDHVDTINTHGFTPLLYATELNETELVKKLLAKGANKNHQNDAGRKAYDYAQASRNIELLSLLK